VGDAAVEQFTGCYCPDQATVSWTRLSGEALILGWQADDHVGIHVDIHMGAGHHPRWRHHKGGYGSPCGCPQSPVSMYIGGADHVPNGAIRRVAIGGDANWKSRPPTA
jgi:hypothetical protein